MVNHVKSDQLNIWSDIYATEINCHPSAKTKNAFTQTSAFGSHLARLFNRALQALWQTWMQVCPWTGPRPKVLPVCEQIWKQAANGLCSTKVSAHPPHKL
jgi:hypothetical protein